MKTAMISFLLLAAMNITFGLWLFLKINRSAIDRESYFRGNKQRIYVKYILIYTCIFSTVCLLGYIIGKYIQ